jgi:hypothetical protein
LREKQKNKLLETTFIYKQKIKIFVNPLNAELNPICHFLALLGAHHIVQVSRIRVNISRRQASTTVLQWVRLKYGHS